MSHPVPITSIGWLVNFNVVTVFETTVFRRETNAFALAALFLGISRTSLPEIICPHLISVIPISLNLIILASLK